LNKRLVILGGGESGTGAALLGKHKGWDVFVSDYGSISSHYKSTLTKAGIAFEENQHTERLILNADVVVKSPGIPFDAPVVSKALKDNITVCDEIEFAAQYTNATLIGITGTNGKTTTASLTYHILKKAGLDVALAGNIGQSMAKQLIHSNPEYFVLELSSFQLDGMFDTRLNFGVLLNITPDHLNRYDDFSAYIKSKFQITQNQTEDDVFVYCGDNQSITENIHNIHGNPMRIPFQYESHHTPPSAWVNEGEIILSLTRPKTTFKMSINQVTIMGRHNVYNTMAAAVIANSLSIDKQIIRESLMDFKNVEHRLEFVANVKGIEFINDSKATNVNAAWYALESMNKPVVWIAGGVDKGNDYAQMIKLVDDKVRFIICLGKDNKKIHEAFGKHVEMIYNTSSAQEAVRVAYSLSRNGEAVLLSPACASFDLFEDYEDRGNQFKQAVKQL
jgi:UDP-N-acetylmuramoylalanine--D-glutamate ligase